VTDGHAPPERRAHDRRGAASAAGVGRHRFLGTYFDAFTADQLLDWLHDNVRAKNKVVLAGHNVNSLTLLQRNDRFRAFYARADAIYVDGMPVVGIAKLLGEPLARPHRLGVLDWIDPLAARAERHGWRIVHIGGTDELNELAAAKLHASYPGLDVVGIHGFFDPAAGSPESKAVVERVQELAPDVVLVGMGMPRQEVWLVDWLDSLPPAVYITVGGIFGYLAEDRPTAPRWVGQWGLEWLFRVVTEPRRLWRRYLVEPFALVPALVRAIYHARFRRSR
jgi:N-acetylglucosaminyldiphosphoundecaprenol N-acetyl-beta-D-mannosaminyltransferase